MDDGCDGFSVDGGSLNSCHLSEVVAAWRLLLLLLQVTEAYPLLQCQLKENPFLQCQVPRTCKACWLCEQLSLAGFKSITGWKEQQPPAGQPTATCWATNTEVATGWC